MDLRKVKVSFEFVVLSDKVVDTIKGKRRIVALVPSEQTDAIYKVFVKDEKYFEVPVEKIPFVLKVVDGNKFTMFVSNDARE